MSIERSGAAILIECLKRQGVEFVFGYPGGAVIDRAMGTAIDREALKHQQRIEFIRTLGMRPNDPRLIAARERFAAKYNLSEAEIARAPTERFIDRFSRIYMPAVVGAAVLVAVVPPLAFGLAWGEWVYRALALLLIGCPCALVISTPAAIAAALSAGARRGLLMKGGAVLENLGKVNRVAFDKTGTLTRGRPEVVEVVPLNGHDEAQLLVRAAALATSQHLTSVG